MDLHLSTVERPGDFVDRLRPYRRYSDVDRPHSSQFARYLQQTPIDLQARLPTCQPSLGFFPIDMRGMRCTLPDGAEVQFCL